VNILGQTEKKIPNLIIATLKVTHRDIQKDGFHGKTVKLFTWLLKV
jgi:hypothetical protein